MKNKIIVSQRLAWQNIPEIPAELRELYKTVWEISQKTIIDMAADRGAYICQSQSLNIHMQDANFGKLTSMHFHAWRKGLKTGMYYLRTKAATDAIKFTVEKQVSLPEPQLLAEAVLAGEERPAFTPAPTPLEQVAAAGSFDNMVIDYAQKMDDMACSLDNPEGCEACGS